MATVQIDRNEIDRFQRKLAEQNAIAAWHLAVHHGCGVELPWRPDEYHVSLNVEVDGLDRYEVDHAASLALMRRVARWASKQPDVSIKKEYDGSDFELEVWISDRTKITYSIDRSAVCERKVVGKRIIPAYTSPEREEEIVEWECKPVSVLKA